MCEVWGTTTVAPVDKVIFNWKIENFPRMLKSFSTTGFDSPEFKVTSSDGRVYPLKLRFQQRILSEESGVSLDSIEEDGDYRDCADHALITVSVINMDNVKFCLAGSLILGEDKVKGEFGDPEKAQFKEDNWVFINKSTSISCEYSDGSAEDFTGFCVDSATQTLNMQAEISTPGLVTSSVSLVPREGTVKEIGAKRLAADIKSLLDNSDVFSDFSIVCEGQYHQCHEAILRTRSPVFERMFQQEMKESSSRELLIDDVKKDTVEAMLEYIYTGELTRKVKNESELIYVADKYALAGLLEICFHNLDEVEENMVVDILILADRHNLEDFKKVAMQRILINKSRFVKMEEFVEKINQTPLLLMELFKH